MCQSILSPGAACDYLPNGDRAFWLLISRYGTPALSAHSCLPSRCKCWAVRMTHSGPQSRLQAATGPATQAAMATPPHYHFSMCEFVLKLLNQ